MYSEIGILLILIIIIIAIQIFRTNKTNDNIFKNNIYLDNNGTTEICPEALASYDVCSKYGNASSDYATNAKLLLDENHKLVNSCLRGGGQTYKLIYTSGASESNNTIIKSIADSYAKPHIILSSYEHKSSIDCARLLEKDGKISLTLVSPDRFGFIHAWQ